MRVFALTLILNSAVALAAVDRVPPFRPLGYYIQAAHSFHRSTVWFVEDESDVLSIARPLKDFRRRLEKALRSYYVLHNFANYMKKHAPDFSNGHLNEAIRTYALLEDYFSPSIRLAPLLTDPFVRKYRLRYFAFTNPHAVEFVRLFLSEMEQAETPASILELVRLRTAEVGEELTLFAVVRFIDEGVISDRKTEDKVIAALVANPFFAGHLQWLNRVNDKTIGTYPETAAAVAQLFFAAGGKAGHRARQYLLPMNLFEAIFNTKGLAQHHEVWRPLFSQVPQLSEHARALKCFLLLKGHPIDIDL